MKQRKRKISTEMRHERLLTGGGPPMKKSVDPVLEFVDIIAPNADVQLECSWDSTSVFEAKNLMSCVEPNTKSNTANKENIDEIQITNIRHNETPPTTSSTPTRKIEKVKRLQKSCQRCVCEEETKLRIQKLKESIEQQRELHEKRMKVAEEEVKLAILKTLLAEHNVQN
ncbi:uncharacterized protein LOC111691640 [Anoplophora glabripennis]|uniref:uncharacterized protein LOC111691640 n=1 Tax=Anoplophora glabripennis TaxID=217634 RepID=UPI000C77661B|nr:uncharacterized protein LOC111691640 [Anoplophora glabripennis]